MTSEPDSRSPRRPPTIDLTATEVEADGPGSAQQSGAGNKARQRAGWNSAGLRHHLQGAIAGVIAMAAIFAGLWLGGYLPSRVSAPPAAAEGPKPAGSDEISARLDKIQDALLAKAPEPALASRMAAAEAATKSLGDSLAALNRRVDDIAANAQSALTEAKAASAAADQATGTAKANVQRGDLDALAGRVAALEGAVKSLSGETARRTPSADDRAARLSVAGEALRAAVERGVPYQVELAAVKSLDVGQDATAPLERFAESGVPSGAALAKEIAALTPALLRAADPSPGEGSYLQRLESSAQRLVRITPVDAPPGDESAAVVARINADAARADITAALAEIARLPQSAKAVAQPWAEQAAAREAAIAASRRIAADALAALAKPNPQ